MQTEFLYSSYLKKSEILNLKIVLIQSDTIITIIITDLFYLSNCWLHCSTCALSDPMDYYWWNYTMIALSVRLGIAVVTDSLLNER